MKNFRLSIGQKVLFANIVLTLVFLANTATTISHLETNRKLSFFTNQVLSPSLEALEDFKLLVSNSQRYITDWVFMQENEKLFESINTEKEALKKLHVLGFPSIKDLLGDKKRYWKKKSQVAELDSIIIHFDELLGLEQKIMQALADNSDYGDFSKKFFAEEEVVKKVIPISHNLTNRIEYLIQAKRREFERAEAQQNALHNRFMNTVYILAIVTILLCILYTYTAIRYITKPIKYMNKALWRLSRGREPELSNEFTDSLLNNEVKEMVNALQRLSKGLKSTAVFAQKIGKGQYSSSFSPLSEEDTLGNALLSMRDNLASLAEDAEQRNWATIGVAKFADILRKNQNDLSQFYTELLINLVEYLNANQGAVFIIQNQDGPDPVMTLETCYAWDKEKFAEKEIIRGEGLAGQAWQEKSTLYVDDVPEGYIEITSGLGKKTPTNILIVPIMFNENIFGVIEIASFRIIKKYHIEFVERVCESFASTLTNVRNNQRTRALLEESTNLTAQMKQQEEEMRETITELQSSQEEITHFKTELAEKESLINNTKMTMELDLNFRVMLINKSFVNLLGYKQTDLFHSPVALIFQAEEKVHTLKNILGKDSHFSDVVAIYKKDRTKIYVKFDATPIHDENKRAKKYIVMMEDVSSISDMMKKQGEVI